MQGYDGEGRVGGLGEAGEFFQAGGVQDEVDRARGCRKAVEGQQPMGEKVIWHGVGKCLLRVGCAVSAGGGMERWVADDEGKGFCLKGEDIGRVNLQGKVVEGGILRGEGCVFGVDFHSGEVEVRLTGEQGQGRDAGAGAGIEHAGSVWKGGDGGREPEGVFRRGGAGEGEAGAEQGKGVFHTLITSRFGVGFVNENAGGNAFRDFFTGGEGNGGDRFMCG